MFTWDVDPEIFSIEILSFHLSLRWYSLMFMISFTLGFLIFRWIYKYKEFKPLKDLDPLLMTMMIGTVVGARLGHCLFYDPVYYLSNPLKILMVWEGGLASHGAAIGILLALYYYARKRPDQPFMWLVDRIVITVALAGFFIRLGNLFNSEIIGKAADVPWAILLPRVDMPPIPRHPTQVYEALAYLLIFFILFRIYRKRTVLTPRGLLLGLFMTLVFGARFFIEFYKENQEAFEQGMLLNMGQILSIPLVLAGIVLIMKAREPDEVELKSSEAKIRKDKK
ncbi:MAG: prolipoprotein diacylglyceryl transferase [Calditrichaceae bacterium]|nr:prolipoprotein diacylglyceryl transferase [Calditrichaceae bacterium]MBN2710169.1 prolipoprotein diacylglyceryl transferase [Calditrichaceae bacterium]RQV94145.1 MAG: prolipoprotein diacylglyceryl transferase [Calditrichota bacterium]